VGLNAGEVVVRAIGSCIFSLRLMGLALSGTVRLTSAGGA
jgi:hypothetical protein